MKKIVLAASIAALYALAPLSASAQNIATVNGKPVPKADLELLMRQATKNGQARSPEMEAQLKEVVVRRAILLQEAERRGLGANADVQDQLKLARQDILLRALMADQASKSPISEADMKAEYEKIKAANSGTEYRARHILVEKEDEAKALIKQINGGAKFEDLATKNSKDTGSAANGGDLDFANPNNFVPEFSKAMTALKKGEVTQEPVKSQFGYHVIKLEDTREAQFPAFDDVKQQLKQRMEQMKLAAFQQEVFSKAKTDFKFAAPAGQN